MHTEDDNEQTQSADPVKGTTTADQVSETAAADQVGSDTEIDPIAKNGNKKKKKVDKPSACSGF